MSVHFLAIVQSLIVISAANGAPLLGKRLLGARLARAIDGGRKLPDGRPLLGGSKTWRGLFAAIVLSTCASVLVGLQWQVGAMAGAFAMAGDCLSSFIKRRLGVGPGDMFPGLDQIPESLLPALACGLYLPLDSFDVGAIVLLFYVGQVALSRLSFGIGLRDRPY
jgi:CDP-archaeol synthase